MAGVCRAKGAPLLANRELTLDGHAAETIARRVGGSSATVAMPVLLAGKRRGMGAVSLTLADGRRRKGARKDGKLVFSVPADASLTLSW